MNDKNLVSMAERTPEERRELARKGGIASGKARRKKAEEAKWNKVTYEVLENMEKNHPGITEELLAKMLPEFKK